MLFPCTITHHYVIKTLFFWSVFFKQTLVGIRINSSHFSFIIDMIIMKMGIRSELWPTDFQWAKVWSSTPKSH